MADKIPTLHIDLPPSTPHVAPEHEQYVVLDDAPVSADAVESTGTITIDIVPRDAIAAGRAHAERAAIEAAAASTAGVPPLPDEPKPMSRHGRRWRPARDDIRFQPYARPDSGKPLPEGAVPELVYGLTMTLVNLGDSRTVRARKHLDARIARAVEGDARVIPVISRQGGVGATTVTALLGMALAEVRQDGVLAIDAHPDRGALAERVAAEFTALELESAATPHALEKAIEAAEPDHAVILTDGATGVADPAVRAALRRADSLVLVSGGTAADARIASETVTWLEQHDLQRLAANAVVALDTATPGSRYESLDAIEAHFRARVRDVVRVPYDEELVAGAPARYGALRPDTREAARELAAAVMDGVQADAGRRAA